MKGLINILTILAILAMAATLNAATLRWDASTGAAGYNIYFTDGTDDFNYNAGNVTEVPDIDNTLNLHPGTTYTFTAKAYNEAGESGASNSVDYTTADAYTIPENSIPVRVERPATITIIVE